MFQFNRHSGVCLEDLCRYVQHPFGAYYEMLENPPDIHDLLHSPCDNCSTQNEQEPLCDFCRHLRLRHLAICLQDRLRTIEIERGALSDTRPSAMSRILSTEGCSLCSVMTSAIRAHSVIEDQGIGHIRRERTARVGLTLRLRRTEIQMDLELHNLFLYPKVFYVQSPGSIPLVAGRISWSPIRERISRCSPSTSRSSTPEIPQGFRLIDVDKRLLVSDFPRASRLGSDIKFVALSYVWGHSTISEDNALLGCNESKLSATGALGQGKVPRAVDDAITVCQQLRQRFLWVDRYCIQQDGKGLEKQAQINSMGDIFSSAEFTIIHAKGTCIDDPLPGVSITREVLQTRANVCGLEVVSGYPDMRGAMSQSKWNERGWTYQESVLCPRQLIFTSHEVWFECDDKDSPYWREHFPESTINTVDSSGLLGHRLSADYEFTKFDRYRRHLESYTARSLALESDIVNAFTGVLTALYDGDLGIYGLPEPDFDRAVLWHVRTGPLTSVSGKNNFPSWSWASAGFIVTAPVISWSHFKGPLVHWTYKGPTGELKAIKSRRSYDGAWLQRTLSYLLAAWWKGCLEAPVPDDVKHAPAPICGRRESARYVQRHWIQRLCEHLEKHESCQECESYIEQRWLSLDQLWTDIRKSAGWQRIHEPSYGSYMVDRSLAENSRPGVLLTRAQTARIRVGKNPNCLWSLYWCFVDAEGRRIGKFLPEEPRTDEDGLQASLYGNLVECMAVSLSDAWTQAGQWPGVNVLIIDQQEESLFARRIGVGWIYLWDWAKADRTFKNIALE